MFPFHISKHEEIFPRFLSFNHKPFGSIIYILVSNFSDVKVFIYISVAQGIMTFSMTLNKSMEIMTPDASLAKGIPAEIFLVPGITCPLYEPFQKLSPLYLRRILLSNTDTSSIMVTGKEPSISFSIEKLGGRMGNSLLHLPPPQKYNGGKAILGGYRLY